MMASTHHTDEISHAHDRSPLSCHDLTARRIVGCPTMNGTVVICGVPVDDVDMADTVEIIWDLVRDGRSTGRRHRVATVNVDFVVNAIEDASIANILQTTSLSIPDGMPLVWGARLIGGRLRTRVAGADLVPALARRASADGTVIALYGAGPGVAERAAARLSTDFPGARIVGLDGPSFGSVDELSHTDLADLVDVGADIACIAFGHPKQERFIERFSGQLDVPVMIGVGGSLDFLVGEKRRAPVWMQRFGVEWLHRMVTEPRRLVGRYSRDARVFIPAIARQALHRRRARTLRPTVRGDLSIGLVVADAVDRTIEVSLDNATTNRIATELRAARRAGQLVEVRSTSRYEGK